MWYLVCDKSEFGSDQKVRISNKFLYCWIIIIILIITWRRELRGCETDRRPLGCSLVREKINNYNRKFNTMVFHIRIRISWIRIRRPPGSRSGSGSRRLESPKLPIEPLKPHLDLEETVLEKSLNNSKIDEEK